MSKKINFSELADAAAKYQTIRGTIAIMQVRLEMLNKPSNGGFTEAQAYDREYLSKAIETLQEAEVQVLQYLADPQF